jgi:hypothetical protein
MALAASRTQRPQAAASPNHAYNWPSMIRISITAAAFEAIAATTLSGL